MDPSKRSEEYISLIDTERIYQQAPSGHISVLKEGHIIKINDTLLKWLGYSRDELVNQLQFAKLLSKGGAIHYELFFRPMININGQVRELKYELVKKNGSTLPVLLSAAGVFANDGSLQAINMDFTDITHRDLYEKELLSARNLARAEKERFELVAALSPEIIWTVDYEGKISYLNNQGKAFFQSGDGAPVSAVIFSRIHPEDRINLKRDWLENDIQDANSTRIRLMDAAGEYRWFELKIIATHNTNTDIKWFGTCVDIESHIKDMQRKDEFIQLASHELRTPVTVLQAYLQFLQMNELPDTVKNYVDKSISTLRNFEFLIASLLNVQVINSGEMQLTQSEFCMNDLVIQLTEQFKIAAPARKVDLQLPAMKLYVKADRERMVQVIINLLNNAVKYSADEANVILCLESLPSGSRLRLSVQDFGIGIAPENIERLSERYYREGSMKNITGLGLGLYITQNILEAHQAELKVSSVLKEGSVFSFELPVVADC